jgi:hypothetical protein
MTAKITMSFVDGAYQEFVGDHYVRRYHELTALGYTGRRMIEALFGDDWGAPPRFAEVVDSDGKIIAKIVYK